MNNTQKVTIKEDSADYPSETLSSLGNYCYGIHDAAVAGGTIDTTNVTFVESTLK
jgi:hypothetical protein